MSTGPIHPTSDTRVVHEYAELNGRRFHYVRGQPTSGREPKGTVVCVHGWPDMWYGWKNIIPQLLDLDLQVIAIDCMGYGGTECPRDTLSAYSFKTHADAIAELMKQLNILKIILLGHDWGSMVVYRTYNYYPNLVSHIASICIPYAPPVEKFTPLPQLVQLFPSMTYQLALSNPQTANDLQTKESIRNFLKGIIRATDEGGRKFNVANDIVASVGDLPRSRLLSPEDLEFRVEHYHRNGFFGPLNWYKTRKVNFDDEKAIKDPRIRIPMLFIETEKDAVVTKQMVELSKRAIDNLTLRSIKVGHWAMLEKPDEVNGFLKEWFQGVVFARTAKL